MYQRAAWLTQRAKGTPNARSNRQFPHASPAQAATKVVAFTVAKQHTPATISFINNQGDLGATWNDLTSERSLNNLGATMLTAGALHGLGNQIKLDIPDANGINIATRLNDIKVASGWVPNLSKNLITSATSATLNTAIHGGDWGTNLGHGLTSGLIDTVAQQGAYAIGNATTGQNSQPPTLDSTGKNLAHFALGCAVGSASTGSVNGCAPGAIGAVVGENTAEYAKTHNLTDADALALAKVMAGTSGLLTGGMDNAGEVNIAAMTGGNAAENNYLKHADAMRLAALEAKAKTGTLTPRETDERAALINLDKQNQSDLNGACNSAAGGNAGSQQCKSQYANLQLADVSYNNYQGMTAQDLRAELGNIGTIQQSLIMYNPAQPSTNGQTNRDRLTGMPLDEKGRYSKTVTLDGKSFTPKFYPCSDSACITGGKNLDTSDPATKAYVKALDAQVFKDINTGSTMATLITPTGVLGTALAGTGLATSVGSAFTDSDVLHQTIKNASQMGAAEFFVKVLGHTESAAGRFVALIDLSGGWDAFTKRVKLDLLEIKPNTEIGQK